MTLSTTIFIVQFVEYKYTAYYVRSYMIVRMRTKLILLAVRMYIEITRAMKIRQTTWVHCHNVGGSDGGGILRPGWRSGLFTGLR